MTSCGSDETSTFSFDGSAKREGSNRVENEGSSLSPLLSSLTVDSPTERATQIVAVRRNTDDYVH
jgi:hypothetical protein